MSGYLEGERSSPQSRIAPPIRAVAAVGLSSTGSQAARTRSQHPQRTNRRSRLHESRDPSPQALPETLAMARQFLRHFGRPLTGDGHDQRSVTRSETAAWTVHPLKQHSDCVIGRRMQHPQPASTSHCASRGRISGGYGREVPCKSQAPLLLLNQCEPLPHWITSNLGRQRRHLRQ